MTTANRATAPIFGRPYIGDEEIAEVIATLRSGWVGCGPKVATFEQRFAEYTGAKHAIALSSCTAALHLALIAAGIGPGDEVITSPMTFVATANAILYVGATPVFADIDRKTMTINPDTIEASINSRTKAIIPVHMAGRPCDMDAIHSVAETSGLTVIEDAAHAIEAFYQGKKIGSISDFTVFSFYATKSICTGEGGMLTTSSDATANLIRTCRLHGLDHDAWRRFAADGTPSYDAIELGYKYNMTDIQASLGIPQLARVEKHWAHRRILWNAYNDCLHDVPGIILPLAPEAGTRHAYHLYTILIQGTEATAKRDHLILAMNRSGYTVGIHYLPVHLMSYYRRRFNYHKGMFPESEWVGERTVSLPLTAHMSVDDVVRVTACVRKSLAMCADRSRERID